MTLSPLTVEVDAYVGGHIGYGINMAQHLADDWQAQHATE